MIMTVDQALEYIHSNYWNGGVFGLDRTKELMRLVGNPYEGLKFIHIGGTNGKGSTASMSASILRAAGYTVGLYTSPYIFRFHERMQVNGECISDEELVEITERIKPIAQSMESEPSEFELVTAIAFEYFRRHKCDIICLEVGLGGELDATNVIAAPEVAVMTNIGLDHTELLGDTLEKIAETKSKIIKPGCQCVIYREPASVEAVFEARCKEVGAELNRADFDSLKLRSASLEGQVFDWGRFEALELPLLGQHQLKNAAVVIEAVEKLRKKGWNIDADALERGLYAVSWPARFGVVDEEPYFIVDGGHNPQCAQTVRDNLLRYFAEEHRVLLIGVLADKDYMELADILNEAADEYVCVAPDSPRALPAAELGEYLESYGKPVQVCDSIPEAVAAAKEAAGENGVVCAVGSLYMAGPIRAEFGLF